MANWNLSVDLRGQGDDLARALRTSAGHARDLGAAAREAQDEVKDLGTASGVTAKAVKKVGTASETAAGRLTIMAGQAKAAAKEMRKLERALADTDAQIRAMADRVRITADIDDQTTAGLATIRAAIADLRTLSTIDVGASLQDDTGTGLASIREGLADLERMSPVILRTTMDDDTAAGVAQVRTAITNLRALSPVDITANFDGDPAQLAAAATAVGELRDHADSANTALATMTTRAAAAATALNTLQQEAQDASRALRTLRGRAAAAAAALDELGDRARHAATGLRSLGTGANRANGHLTTLSGNTRTLRGDLDTLDGSLTQVTGHMGGLRGTLGRVSTATGNTSGNLAGASSNMQNLILAAIGLGSALLPIAAAIVPIAAGLGAAGVAIGVFGAAVGGQIVALTEAAEAEKEYDQAIREHGATSAEAAKAETEYLRLLSEMPPASRETAAALSVLKDEYKDWSNALAGDTMPVVTKSMGLFRALLPELTPLVRGTSDELDHLMNVAAGAMATPGFDRFMGKFTQFATEALSRGTTNLIQFSEALERGDVGDDLREFLDYARTNAPLVGETLKNLAQAIIHLLAAFADMGVSVLTAVNALAQLINAIPASALSTFVQLYATLKLVSLGMGLVAAAAGAGAVTRIAAFSRSLMFGGVGPAISGVTQRMSALTKASIGLGVLAVAAIGISKLAEKARGAPPDVDRLTTSLKELAESGKFTGELKKTFGDVDGVVKKLGELGDAAKESEEYVESFANSGIGPLDDLRKGAHNLWSDFADGEKSLSALKDDFAGLDQSMAGMVSNGYGTQAAADFRLIETAAKKAGHSTKEIAELFPEYKDALAALAAEQKLAAAGMGVFGAQAQAVGTKLAAQKQSADGLRASIVALNDVNRSAYDSEIAFEASIDALTAAFKENGATLDIATEAGRKNGTAMSGAAKAHDEMIASGLAAGESLGSMTTKSNELRGSMMRLAVDAFDGNKKKATEYVNTLLGVPGEIATAVKLEKEEAIAGLRAVQAEILKTPGAKSVKVDTLNAAAIKALEAVGYKTRTLPDGRTEVYAANGQAIGAIGEVSAALFRLNGQTAHVYTKHHYENITTNRTINTGGGGRGPNAGAQANGSVLDFYADGGLRPARARRFADGGMENHVAQIAPAGDWRVWAEEETGGESYIPLAPSKRPRSRAIAEETVRRLGGDPGAIQWNAGGNVTDWRYDPTTGSLYSPTDAGSAGNRTKKVKGKDVSYFDLGAVERRLRSTAAATRSWNRDLEKVADRLGGDVADALAGMGKDGVALARKMATGSKKYAEEMAKALRELTEVAKASLTDYTRQLNSNTKLDATFSKNLSTLAGRGYGDLAAQLAAQNDPAAQQLAAAAVKDKSKAGAANEAAKKSNNALTSEQVQDLVAIIAAIRTSKTGIHDVAASTGLGEDEIVATSTKALSQIKSALGGRAAKFLADLGRASKGLSYANGGIREGIYATQAGAVTFAEPSTGGEAYIPLGASKRAAATNVLRDVAGRFGVGLTDAAGGAGRIVIIREQGPLIGSQTWQVTTGGSATDTARRIDADNAYQLRRLARGGVAAR